MAKTCSLCLNLIVVITSKQTNTSQARWHRLVTLVLGRLRQNDGGFEASLGCIRRLSFTLFLQSNNNDSRAATRTTKGKPKQEQNNHWLSDPFYIMGSVLPDVN